MSKHLGLRPLNDTFLFQFFNDEAQGKFIPRIKSSIILTNQDYDQQGKDARWAKVLAVGKDVVDFGVGDIVLIEALQWTVACKHNETKFWKSDQSKVCAIGLDESVTYQG